MKALVIILSLVAMSTSALAHDIKDSKNWPPDEKECPKSVEHFAIVTEQTTGTNNTLFCKLVDGYTYKYKDNPNMKVADYIDCTANTIEVNALVLISKGYYETWDKLGKKRCMNTVGLIKVIGKVAY